MSIHKVCLVFALAGGGLCEYAAYGQGTGVENGAGVKVVSPGAPQSLPGNYVLGPDDVVSIQGIGAEEFNAKPMRIGTDGEVHLPIGGTIQASGLTVQAFEKEVSQRLSEFYRHPDFVVNVVEVHSQPVSVIGAVRNPGIYQAQGRKTLVELLAMAGGVRDDAGYLITVKRRSECPFTLPNAVMDETTHTSSTTIVLNTVGNSAALSQDIPVCGNDLISVPVADLVYVVGEVHKAGGFVLKQNDRITALTALSMAEGGAHTAALQNARILRKQKGSTQVTQVPVDLKQIIAGKKDDVYLQPDDVLVIPNSLSKNVAIRSIEMGLQIGTGLIIWRGF